MIRSVLLEEKCEATIYLSSWVKKEWQAAASKKVFTAEDNALMTGNSFFLLLEECCSVFNSQPTPFVIRE